MKAKFDCDCDFKSKKSNLVSSHFLPSSQSRDLRDLRYPKERDQVQTRNYRRELVFLLPLIFIFTFYCGTNFVETSKGKCDGNGQWFLHKISSKNPQKIQVQKPVRSDNVILAQPLVQLQTDASSYDTFGDNYDNPSSSRRNKNKKTRLINIKAKEASLSENQKLGLGSPWPLLITVLGLPLILIPLLALIWLTLLHGASYSPFQNHQQPYRHHETNDHDPTPSPQYDYIQYDRLLT